ncbi:MAG: prepilin-type N-terminal cleavage/methylation domain-containing protein [Candidatus Omnitrophota bacterium]
MKMTNKSGFTLLEIIIVVIIIGVLASLALPRFLNTVEASRAGEALQNISAIRGALARCQLINGSYVPCADSWNNLDISNPTNAPGTHFTYSITAGATSYTVVATRNSTNGGTSGNLITLIETSTTISKSGTGAFVSIR